MGSPPRIESVGEGADQGVCVGLLEVNVNKQYVRIMVKQSTSVTREPTNCKALKPTVTNRKKKRKDVWRLWYNNSEGP